MITNYKVEIAMKNKHCEDRTQKYDVRQFEVTSFVVNPLSETIIFFMKDESTNSVINTSITFNAILEIQIFDKFNKCIYSWGNGYEA